MYSNTMQEQKWGSNLNRNTLRVRLQSARVSNGEGERYLTVLLSHANVCLCHCLELKISSDVGRDEQLDERSAREASTRAHVDVVTSRLFEQFFQCGRLAIGK